MSQTLDLDTSTLEQLELEESLSRELPCGNTRWDHPDLAVTRLVHPGCQVFLCGPCIGKARKILAHSQTFHLGITCHLCHSFDLDPESFSFLPL